MKNIDYKRPSTLFIGAFDEDGSGTIDANELRIVMEMMGQKPNPEEISRLITEADAGTTGEIDFKQFKKVMALQK